jgi:hypothetical protein
MSSEDHGDREVPAIDMAAIEAFGRVVRKGHDKREVADRFYHWGRTMLRVLDGAEEMTERLSADRRDIAVEELIANAVDGAKRKDG